MPIPSLSSALRPRNQVSRAKDASSRSEDPQAHDDAVSSSKQQDSGDGAKRRSFLPQRGLPKSIHRTVGLAGAPASKTQPEDASDESVESRNGSNHPTLPQHNVTQSTKQGRLRPRSLYQPSSTHRIIGAEDDVTASSQSARPTDTTIKPPLSAGLSRSQSLRRPGVPAPPEQPPSRGHTRAQSTSTTTTARRQYGENAARVERPKSLLVGPSRATKPAGDHTTDATAGPVRTSARLEALRRSTSAKAKPEAPYSRTATTTPISSDEPLPPVGRREASKEVPRKLARPAFSTLQQHFTPRKMAKAPTSAFFHADPDTSSYSLPPEIINLQSELLQLHLLHEVSGLISRQWELSAKNTLSKKFDEVASLYRVMRENERFGQEQKSILALREWNGHNNSLSGLVEHIQALSGPLHELPSLLDPGSRLGRLVDDFDGWISVVEEVWAARNSQRGGSADSKSLQGLGDAWEVQNAALTRKLTAFLRHLDRLPQPAHGSSIACIVSACKQLLGGLLAELQIMKMIEAEVVDKEKQWIEDRLRVMAQDMGAPVVLQGQQAWRM